MKGYIIRNCPKAVTFPSDTKCDGTGKYCMEVPVERCLIKKIVKECEKSVNSYNNQEFLMMMQIYLWVKALWHNVFYT